MQYLPPCPPAVSIVKKKNKKSVRKDAYPEVLLQPNNYPVMLTDSKQQNLLVILVQCG